MFMGKKNKKKHLIRINQEEAPSQSQVLLEEEMRKQIDEKVIEKQEK